MSAFRLPEAIRAGMRIGGRAAIAAAALTLGGCVVSRDEAPPAAAAGTVTPASIPNDKLVGNWGTASFHNEKDRKRTEAQAREQCKLPYVIRKGPSNGLLMHVADDPKQYELMLKAGAGGKTYLGFLAPAGDPQDREILSFSDDLIVMRFVDPEVHRRYGTFVYVRCGATA
jgi:hypothetical protein